MHMHFLETKKTLLYHFFFLSNGVFNKCFWSKYVSFGGKKSYEEIFVRCHLCMHASFGSSVDENVHRALRRLTAFPIFSCHSRTAISPLFFWNNLHNGTFQAFAFLKVPILPPWFTISAGKISFTAVYRSSKSWFTVMS